MNAIQLAGIWIVLLLSLLIRTVFFLTHTPSYEVGEQITFTGTLTTQPTLQGNGQHFRLNTIDIWTARFPAYHYGDTLRVSGRISKPKTSNQKSSLLGKIQQDFTMYFPKIEADTSSSASILPAIGFLRENMLSTINHSLPAGPAALFSGIFLGSKEAFTKGFLDTLRNTGTLHVVAASGMNITMLSTLLMILLLKRFNRKVVALLVIISICFYALLSLLQPSIVRAAIMGGVVSLASLLGRQTQPVWLLALAGYIMLLFDPFLIFDIGFQLSFAATGGLLLLKPVLTEGLGLFHHIVKIPIFGEDIATTVVAQLATLPILLINFGSVSLISVLVNILILWTVPIIMALGLGFAITSMIPAVASVFAMFSLPFLLFFQAVVSFFDKSQFVLSVKIPLLAGIGYYLLLLATYVFLKRKIAKI